MCPQGHSALPSGGGEDSVKTRVKAAKSANASAAGDLHSRIGIAVERRSTDCPHGGSREGIGGLPGKLE